MTPPNTLQPDVPASEYESDLIWFPVRVTSAPGGGVYLFTEVWTTPGGVIADKVGGRFNSTADPAYAIDGAAFTVTAAGSAVEVLARRAPGSGGVAWELKGFTSGSSGITNDYATIGNFTIVIDAFQPVGASFVLPNAGTYLLFYSLSGQASASAIDANGQYVVSRLYDVTNAAAVADSTRRVVSVQVITTFASGTASAIVRYVVTASATIRVEAGRSSGGVWTTTNLNTGFGGCGFIRLG